MVEQSLDYEKAKVKQRVNSARKLLVRKIAKPSIKAVMLTNLKKKVSTDKEVRDELKLPMDEPVTSTAATATATTTEEWLDELDKWM